MALDIAGHLTVSLILLSLLVWFPSFAVRLFIQWKTQQGIYCPMGGTQDLDQYEYVLTINSYMVVSVDKSGIHYTPARQWYEAKRHWERVGDIDFEEGLEFPDETTLRNFLHASLYIGGIPPKLHLPQLMRDYRDFRVEAGRTLIFDMDNYEVRGGIL